MCRQKLQPCTTDGTLGLGISPHTGSNTLYDSKGFIPNSHRHPPIRRRDNEGRVILPSAKMPPRVVANVLLLRLERMASALPATDVGIKNNHAEEPVSRGIVVAI